MDAAHAEGRLLFVVQEPETIDFSDFALPPGIDAEKARATIAVGLRQMANRGWQADLCMVRPDGTAANVIARQLSSATYVCVVIGGALRLPSNNSPLFQVLVDAVRKSAPSASISFNVLSEAPTGKSALLRVLKRLHYPRSGSINVRSSSSRADLAPNDVLRKC